MKNVAKPITKVIRPSIKNNHLCVHVNTSAGNSRYLQDKQGGEETYRQPACPPTPLIRKIPNARKLAIISHASEENQNKARRNGSSYLL